MSHVPASPSARRPGRAVVSRLLPGLVLLAAAVPLAACGTPAVTASTTCDEFLGMDEQVQETGVEKLAAHTHGSGFKGPMGILNLVYDCQSSPHSTVGGIMGVSS